MRESRVRKPFLRSEARSSGLKFGKYCSTVRLFTVNLPEPARRNTRAIDSLRRPVPRNQLVPAMGVPVELNAPPQLSTAPRCSGPATSRFGLLPTRRRKAPQRAETLGTLPVPNCWRLEYRRLLHPPEQQSPDSAAQPLGCA